jgi:hypothetical protein
MMQELALEFLDMSPYRDLKDVFATSLISERPEEERRVVEWQCYDQKIRSRGEAQNFGVAGLVTVATICTTIIAVGIGLEPCVRFWRGRRARTKAGTARRMGEVREFARAVDNIYWLLHAGLRGSGAGPWMYGAGELVEGETIPTLDGHLPFGPPVESDGAWAPFYRPSSPSNTVPGGDIEAQ